MISRADPIIRTLKMFSSNARLSIVITAPSGAAQDHPGHDIAKSQMSGFGGMMGGYHTMMGNLGTLNSFISGLSLIGLVSGIFVIIGAVMVNTRPIEHVSWGLIILVFSITSFLGTGGFIIGAILGIMGGVLAMSWKPGSKS